MPLWRRSSGHCSDERPGSRCREDEAVANLGLYRPGAALARIRELLLDRHTVQAEKLQAFRGDGAERLRNRFVGGEQVWERVVRQKGDIHAPYGAVSERRADRHHLASGLKGGHSGGGYITTYRITMNKVQDYLKREGGWRSIKDILDHCETHYASPRASLAKALQDFEDDWCEMKKEGRQAVFSIPGSDFNTPVRAINAS